VAFFLIIAVIAIKPMTNLKSKQPKQPPTNEGINVRTSFARTGDMASVIEVSGDIKALKSTVLSAKIGGRIVSVPYREGDYVCAGTVVVQQDTSDLNDQVRQAEAALLAAKARLSQAITTASLSDTQTEAQISQAKAALEAARANYELIRKGARSQEIATAENAVASAKANYENAKTNLERMRALFAEGALSKQQLDLAQMQYDVAHAQYESAKQQLSLIKAGAREEQIEAAEKQVKQAEEALRIAKANRAQKALRHEDIKAAKAAVAQAEAALAFARQQVINASITTPISGTISKRMAEPGQMATPGVPLIEVVALNTVYFEAEVSEIEIAKVKVGQPVTVTVDALPGKKFHGKVFKILPTADTQSRHFAVRIAIPNSKGEIKPGMFARGSIEIARHKNTVIIPKDALIVNGEGRAVYVVVNSTAKFKPITTGFESREEIEVLSGIKPNDEIVIVGQDKLSDGVKVNVVN
jgi:RND family efflux transporter MFP subunit